MTGSPACGCLVIPVRSEIGCRLHVKLPSSVTITINEWLQNLRPHHNKGVLCTPPPTSLYLNRCGVTVRVLLFSEQSCSTFPSVTHMGSSLPATDLIASPAGAFKLVFILLPTTACLPEDVISFLPLVGRRIRTSLKAPVGRILI